MDGLSEKQRFEASNERTGESEKVLGCPIENAQQQEIFHLNSLLQICF